MAPAITATRFPQPKACRSRPDQAQPQLSRWPALRTTLRATNPKRRARNDRTGTHFESNMGLAPEDRFRRRARHKADEGDNDRASQLRCHTRNAGMLEWTGCPVSPLLQVRSQA